MTIKKTKLTSKIANSIGSASLKPSTITRAAITAEIKLTRGKQLVEHSPISLIPDPNNPRPDDKIDDNWLKNVLFIGTENSLCRFDKDNEYIIPGFKELTATVSSDLEDDYEFLRGLAYSIRNDGLIEPIEIFLADKNFDPEYFINSQLEYGYVVLEGHQRRLAGIMAGVKTVTCIEITDETMLARLKVKHRKLRRQLSENNLRKGLSVGQNYKIVKQLLNTDDCMNISSKELSSIIGLNEYIAGALKRLTIDEKTLPESMIKLIENSQVSFKWIRTWIGKPNDQIEIEVERIISGNSSVKNISKPVIKPRGRKGGAVKKSAIFKVNKEQDSILLLDFIFKMIPELKINELDESSFHGLENVLNRLLELAKRNQIDPGHL